MLLPVCVQNSKRTKCVLKNDSAVICDEIIDATKAFPTKTVPTKGTSTKFYVLVNIFIGSC